MSGLHFLYLKKNCNTKPPSVSYETSSPIFHPVCCCQYDRAVMALGNVSNNGDASTPANDSMVYIEWDVIVININDTASNDNVHWVSAGAAYDNDSEVWVGQMSFTAEPGPSSVSAPHGSTLIKFCCCREIVIRNVVVVCCSSCC